ncbi:MAG: hypothetical protein QM759_08135 [Terricaulis sp.]
MRTTFLAALALATVAFPSLATAASTDQNAAVALCRNEVATQAGVDGGDLRLTQVRDRLSSVRVHFSFFRNGAQTGVDCEVSRHQGALQIASINPPLTATAAAVTPATGN